MNPKLIKLVEFISSSSLYEGDHCNATPNKSTEEYAEFCESIPSCEQCAFSNTVHKERFSATLDAFNEYKNSNSNSNS